jgi:hypothetical protein
MNKLKGQSYTTPTVHYAKQIKRTTDGSIGLIQMCGSTRRQRCYIAAVPAETAVTCKRCGAYDDK